MTKRELNNKDDFPMRKFSRSLVEKFEILILLLKIIFVFVFFFC